MLKRTSKALLVFLFMGLVVLMLSHPHPALAQTPVANVESGSLDGLPQANIDQIGFEVRRAFNIFFAVLGFIAAGFIAWNAVNLGRRDPRARQEAMSGLGYSILGAVLLFGTWFIISLAAGFFSSGGGG